jgi:prohibitin 1
MVNLTLRVLSKPDVERLPKIFTSLGLDYDERVLPSIGNEVLKAVVVIAAFPSPPKPFVVAL